MSLWPHTVELEGVSIPLAGILADLIIHHGRTDISDDPTATTCQITLLDVEKELVQAFEVGQTLAVTAKDGAAPAIPRFTGRVTDARLDVDDLTIIATGEVSRLKNYVIGSTDWPVETWSARVTRCFTEADLDDRLELVPDPLFNPQLAARDVDTAGATTLGDYLAFLAPMVGALVSDRMNGDILVQAVGARTLDDAYDARPRRRRLRARLGRGAAARQHRHRSLHRRPVRERDRHRRDLGRPLRRAPGDDRHDLRERARTPPTARTSGSAAAPSPTGTFPRRPSCAASSSSSAPRSSSTTCRPRHRSSPGRRSSRVGPTKSAARRLADDALALRPAPLRSHAALAERPDRPRLERGRPCYRLD